MCDDEDIKDSPYMAFIHPATGDYNPDLVNQLLCFYLLVPGPWFLTPMPEVALSSMLRDGREESFGF